MLGRGVEIDRVVPEPSVAVELDRVAEAVGHTRWKWNRAAGPVADRYEEVHGQAVLMRPVRSNASPRPPARLAVDEYLPGRRLLHRGVGRDDHLAHRRVDVGAAEIRRERAVRGEIRSARR